MIEKVNRAKEILNQVIIGQEKVVHLIFVSLLAKGHILLESTPGSGKTKLAKSFSKISNVDFKRVQFTPDVLPSDITGIQFFNPKSQSFEMRIGPIQTNVLLVDEINRATPRTQSSLLEVMEEQQTTIEGETIHINSPFLVIATQNPIESNQGTFPLPEAQLDRFLMKIPLQYPTADQEKSILSTNQLNDPIDNIQPLLQAEEIIKMQREIMHVEVSDVVKDYLLEIIQETRTHPDSILGASTRGALAFMRAAQAHAYLQARNFVNPQDIKELAPYILSHRMMLTLEGSIKKSSQDVLYEILGQVKVPVELESH
ncbi:MAG: AAA family ATPase [Bacillota bacterium]|uniref:AAA family ATPase n=1 Tax=unclassified Virgibacillus TaxID=2620237 RepID=UPI0019636347|nr:MULTISPECIES: MoxR family ATPase [unclassified Virgibacillus]MCC2249573.1 MoxR family ATPase [Virgibacillus sp. AGTR]MDY7044517.1 MoxR family ATPase [Virgibacillus sp. M23]QRZ19347.1 MoxR family ATPase [Virgibacillus sp. AGTR]